MEQKVVTVIGGTGFVGRYIVKQLAEQGYTVQVIARKAMAAKFLKPLGSVGQIVLTPGNVLKPETIAGKLAGSIAVINATGILFESGKQRFNTVHAKAPEKLAQLAVAEGVSRFIHISALAVDKAKSSAYARSKLNGEQAVKAAFPTATILRPSVVFGPEDDFYNQFASIAGLSPALPSIMGGKTRFQPVYVGDVARAVVACIEHSSTQGATYELGGPQVYSFREILKYIMKVIGKKRFLLPMPQGLASFVGLIFETLNKIPLVNLLFRKPLLTRDQVKLLQTDNVVSPGSKQLSHLGITPTAVEMVVPEYLDRHVRKDMNDVKAAA